MCEQAARYCRAGVQRLLRKPPPALRGLDGLLRWVGARMVDKGLAERELLSSGAAAEQKKGTSVILDVSEWSPRPAPLGPAGGTPAATSLPARILHRLGAGVTLRVLHSRTCWGRVVRGPASAGSAGMGVHCRSLLLVILDPTGSYSYLYLSCKP